MIGDPKVFKFFEVFTNDNGKASMSGLCGFLVVCVGLLCFMMGVVDYMFVTKTTQIFIYSSGLIVTGSGLLGYRKGLQVKNI